MVLEQHDGVAHSPVPAGSVVPVHEIDHSIDQLQAVALALVQLLLLHLVGRLLKVGDQHVREAGAPDGGQVILRVERVRDLGLPRSGRKAKEREVLRRGSLDRSQRARKALPGDMEGRSDGGWRMADRGLGSGTGTRQHPESGEYDQ